MKVALSTFKMIGEPLLKEKLKNYNNMSEEELLKLRDEIVRRVISEQKK